MQLVSAHLTEVLPRLLPIIPALRERFYMLGSRRIAEHVWHIEWGMPRSKENMRVVSGHRCLEGIDGRGKILWECPDAYHHMGGVLYHDEDRGPWTVYDEARQLARLRGFEIKPTMEFTSWLKTHMQNLVQAHATDGLSVLVQSLLRQR
jgi:hypothetical protein